MPELPEVETVVRTLEKQIKDCQIKDVHIFYDKILKDPKHFKEMVVGQHFRFFMRRGKYLLFTLDRNTLVVHLRMEGKFYVQEPQAKINKHIHICFSLDNGMELRYMDTRKFGRMEIVELHPDLEHFHDLGPEPFAKEFNVDYVYHFLQKKKIPIKAVLLDQHFVAGIGNIYADEILAHLAIRPKVSAYRLSKKKCLALIGICQKVLKKAITLGGTTIRTYTSSLGVSGRFQLECIVHGKKICPKCQTEIKIVRVQGRSSYYCPHCQKS